MSLSTVMLFLRVMHTAPIGMFEEVNTPVQFNVQITFQQLQMCAQQVVFYIDIVF